jgi:hypothetical protein
MGMIRSFNTALSLVFETTATGMVALHNETEGWVIRSEGRKDQQIDNTAMLRLERQYQNARRLQDIKSANSDVDAAALAEVEAFRSAFAQTIEQRLRPGPAVRTAKAKTAKGKN